MLYTNKRFELEHVHSYKKTLNYLGDIIFFLISHRTVPRALGISFAVVIVLYVLTNVAYFTVLSPEETIRSKAVAVVRGIVILASRARCEYPTKMCVQKD